MLQRFGLTAAIAQAFTAWIPARLLGEEAVSVRAEAGIAAGGPVAMPVSALDPTVSDNDIDDACVGCEATTGLDCQRCAYLLEAINRIPVMPPIEPIIPSKPIFLPALPAREAAIAFVAHLRKHDKCGTFSNGGLKNAYLLYCQQQRRRPTADNVLREAMAMLPGVSKESIRDKSQRSKRARLTEWVIAPTETVSATVSRRPRLVQSEMRPAA